MSDEGVEVEDVEDVDEDAGTERAEPPLPYWLEELRPDQVTAMYDILAAYGRGAKVVFLDAPTGAGKTLIAELVRRRLNTKGIYVCSGIQLQEQFVADYPYAQVLKGRNNYPTELMAPNYTAEDCLGNQCMYCRTKKTCPYEMAKAGALGARLAVLNTAYFLAEANSGGRFGSYKDGSKAPFVVVDECDTLEAALMGFVELRVSAQMTRTLGIQPPVKGARVKTVQRWMTEELVPALEERIRLLKAVKMLDLDEHRQVRKLTRLMARAKAVKLDGEKDEEGKEIWGDWIREYPSDWEVARRGQSFLLKPVVIDKWANHALWRHSDKWLCMSATIISAEEQAKSLGLDEAGIPWEVVSLGMRFEPRRRQIVLKMRANMTYKTAAEEQPKLVGGVREVLGKFPDENVLIHTVSYKLGQYLWNELAGAEELDGRELMIYTNARDRDMVVRNFRRRGGVLLASSLDRGIDLPDDLCRVVIVAKIPFPSLNDRRVSERMRRPAGQMWYGVQVARSLVQMTGRGVRHEEDWAVAYILDRQFQKFYARTGRKVLPLWWKEAVVAEFEPVDSDRPTMKVSMR